MKSNRLILTWNNTVKESFRNVKSVEAGNAIIAKRQTRSRKNDITKLSEANLTLGDKRYKLHGKSKKLVQA